MTDWANDPNNDYDLVIEILHNDIDVGVIHKGKDGYVLKWYANKNDLSVPLDWFAKLIEGARRDLKVAKENFMKIENSEKE